MASLRKFKVTPVGDKIAVVLYGRTGKPVMQGFMTKADSARMQPLFRRYLTVAETAELNSQIEAI